MGALSLTVLFLPTFPARFFRGKSSENGNGKSACKRARPDICRRAKEA